MQHVIVYQEAGRFAGWPANNGVWSWDGREILVGFTTGGYAEQRGHNIALPYHNLLARSRDGGETWTVLDPGNFVGRGGAIRQPSGGLDFTQPGFAMRVEGTGYHGSSDARGAFYVSRDRGETWGGPYSFGSLTDADELRGLEITARTDYVVNGPSDCLVMMSARGAAAGGADKAFCARTTDGGATFRFVSWIVPLADLRRAMMPSTASWGASRLVTALRRREIAAERCWVDAYGSLDGGETWSFLSKVGDTGPWNGNPPALARLHDGRLCCVYGDRAHRRIVARYSTDASQTWGEETVLRADYQADAYDEPDLGYPRVVQRSDGQLVAIYYWAARAIPHSHIAATIWEPSAPGRG
ncbi:MAG: exo-alpha-sialidase [Chloroflexi bacterium]|nr:exo-alpha-sialidase [Chloroflexota bacterium]